MWYVNGKETEYRSSTQPSYPVNLYDSMRSLMTPQKKLTIQKMNNNIANKDNTSSSISQPSIFKRDNALVEVVVEHVEQKSNLQKLNNNNPKMADESTNPKEDLPVQNILQH